MVTRLTVTTALVALFAVAFSFLVQDGTNRPGSAFASVQGSDCSYQAGVVCPIVRSEVARPEKDGANF